MSDVRVSAKPLLHPVLSLRKEPARTEASARGKKESDIVVERLAAQREVLDVQVSAIIDAFDYLNVFSGELFIVAEMFDDSFAISKSPKDLFQGREGTTIVGAAFDGYLVETDLRQLSTVRDRIRNGHSIPVRCDISRVRTIRPYDASDLYRGRSLQSLWDDAAPGEAGKKFNVWLPPFRDEKARIELITKVETLRGEGIMSSTAPNILIERSSESEFVSVDVSRYQNSLAVAQRRYRARGHARAIVEVRNPLGLQSVVASGGIFRIEPVKPVLATSPGQGEEPGSLPSDIGTQPVVGLVDGGCTAQRYRAAEAWREPPLVGAISDGRHGNKVASVIVHGHEWNNNLALPQIYCRLGVAPVLPHKDIASYDPDRVIAYLDAVMSRHPDTRVWNLSWNERNSVDPVLVSALGHDLASLARKHRILLVISAGNVSNTEGKFVAPPADCEAALVVGSRGFDLTGTPQKRCPESLPGFGPELQLVPHVTSFSPLRTLGGDVTKGTSFSTGLISSLAAHTFENLRDPSPDLVRALVVAKTDLDRFDPELGWGTPSSDNMPWNCPPGSVSMAFTARLKPGEIYHWQDIAIPREMIRDGKLYGVASITTVHRPLCNEEGGPNYFASRIAAAVQYPNSKGDYKRLVGSKEDDDTPELRARSEEHKWQPVRRNCRDFTKRGGIIYSGNSFRIYARAFARNLKQFGYASNADIPEIETVFVITFSDGTRNGNLYNSMVTSLGNYVESAVLNQDIHIDT